TPKMDRLSQVRHLHLPIQSVQTTAAGTLQWSHRVSISLRLLSVCRISSSEIAPLRGERFRNPSGCAPRRNCCSWPSYALSIAFSLMSRSKGTTRRSGSGQPASAAPMLELVIQNKQEMPRDGTYFAQGT